MLQTLSPDDWTPYKDMGSLVGKTVVVTGATSGIGFQTVKHLASKGAKVYFTARTEAKASKAQAEQIRLNPKLSPDQLPWVLVDFEKIGEVVAAAETIRAQETKIDILVNNAGGLTTGVEYSEAGWESSMTSSHIGHFVFTNGVLPLLKEAAKSPGADVRVVVVSSNTQRMFLPTNYPLDFTKPDVLYGKLPYKPMMHRVAETIAINKNMLHYSISKLANAMFAKELQKLLDRQGLGIAVMALHPGGVRSDDVHTIFRPWVWALLHRGYIDTDVGSFTVLFAATAEKVRKQPELYLGKYMELFGVPHPGHPLLSDDEQSQGLWRCTQKEVDTYLAKKGLPPMLEW